MPGLILRNDIVRYFGTPDRTEGSVNEPREREEYGMRFNEKWTYEHPLRDPVNAVRRVVYWHRYDYVGSIVRLSTDGDWIADVKLAEVLPRDLDAHKE